MHANIISGFITNEFGVASYELRVPIYFTSYELLFCELRVTICCMNNKLRVTFIARVTIVMLIV